MNHDRKLRKILSISERMQELIEEGNNIFIRERKCLRKQTNLKPMGEDFKMEKLENKIAMDEAINEMLELTKEEYCEEKQFSLL